MNETIKQAIERCRGTIFVLLHPDYSDNIAPIRVPVSKVMARAVADHAPKDEQPTPMWESENLILMPNCLDRS